MSHPIDSRHLMTAELPHMTIEELVFMRELHFEDPGSSADTDPLDWPAWTDAERIVPTDEDRAWWDMVSDRGFIPPTTPPPHFWLPSRAYRAGSDR